MIVPEIDVSYSRGFKKSEIRDIINLIAEHYATLIDAWYDTFGQ